MSEPYVSEFRDSSAISKKAATMRVVRKCTARPSVMASYSPTDLKKGREFLKSEIGYKLNQLMVWTTKPMIRVCRAMFERVYSLL